MTASGKAKPEPFRVTVREPRFSVTPGTAIRPGSPGPCPSTPAWLTALEATGETLDLNEVKIHAGRHFVSSLVPDAIPGDSSRRGKAAELAAMIIAMAKPRVSTASRLWLAKQQDPDIQRLCSELLGVGAGVALLDAAKAIDMRSVKKIASHFDFSGRPRGGGALIDLEFKGTVDDASTKDHRLSFRRKLKNTNRMGPPQSRGYDQAIGVTFLGWTHGGKARGADFEVMDPGDPRPEDREVAVRELIRFYAQRYVEAGGMHEAAARLESLAARKDLFDSAADISNEVGRGRAPGGFNRSSLILRRGDESTTYWGTFWQPEFVPHPSVVIDGKSSRQYPWAYVGIDSRIVLMLREHSPFDLLGYRHTRGSFTFETDDKCTGIGLTLSDGTVVLWSSKIPPMEVVIEESA